MSLRVWEDRHLIVSDDGVREQLDGYTQVECGVVDSVIPAVPIHSLKYFWVLKCLFLHDMEY